MRQVPEADFTKYGIIGSGRMALHMQTYLSALRLPYSQWGRKSHSKNQLIQQIQQSSHILILISDSEILNFFTHYKNLLTDKTVVHFSGALSFDCINSAHPLMTFGPDPYDLEFYKNIPFIIEENKQFEELLPGLNNQPFNLTPELKPLYHALCVVSGNFSSMLWANVFDRFQQQLKLPKHILYPYLEKTLLNSIQQGKSCLTGPIVRNDKVTIDKNLAALKGSSLEAVYKQFIDFYKNEFSENQL